MNRKRLKVFLFADRPDAALLLQFFERLQ